MLSLPFLLLPLLVVYVLYYLFYPVTPKKSPLRSVEVGEAQPNEGRPRRWTAHTQLVRQWGDDIHTIPALLQQSVNKYGHRRALGVRKTVKVEEKKVNSVAEGKTVEKTFKTPWQTDYQWITYTQLYQDIQSIGSGLAGNKLQFGQRIALFAATRPEWQVCAQACLLYGFPIVTVYPSLGVDALAYSLNQTNVQHLITQADKLDIALQAASRVSSLKYIIYMDELDPDKRKKYESGTQLKFLSYEFLRQQGILNKVSPSQVVKGKDNAVIMYTSGSTGNPKGVLITHANLLSAAYAVTYVPPSPLTCDDVYIAYLPLAHVLELAAETLFLGIGASIGYSSPTTLNETGVKNEAGQPAGDLQLLRPTVMAAVPLILDRLKASVTSTVNKSNPVMKAVFNTAYYLKHRNYLQKKSSPILDRLVFSKIAGKMGGRMRYMLSGGAPLSQDTQKFINIVFCVPLLQGYGLTETLAANCVTHPDDVTTGNVGAPIPSCEIKLVDVIEMGYTSKDIDPQTHAPTPRGEIVIRGGCVSNGYFDMETQTREVFKKGSNKEKLGEDSDLMWFYSGDIGQWREDGTLMIIDRKKDLVKLSHGEYIALGNLESVYSHSPLVEHIALYADAGHQRPIAIVVPHKPAVQSLASALGITSTSLSTADLYQNTRVCSAVVDDLNKYAAHKKLEKWERIAAVFLTDDEWSPSSGILTEAMKLKRHEIKNRYRQQIEQTYKGVE